MLRLCLLALAASIAAPAQRYNFFESEHFELLTDGSKGRAQDILAQFERVREFFVKSRGFKDPVLKPRIVVFSNEKDYREYSPNAVAAAFYIGLTQRDYIAIGPSSNSDDRRTAVHEYVHLLNRYGDTEMPVWMNEGTAELYSNIEPVGKQIRVGTPIPARIAMLYQEWLPLADVIGADHKSALYNRRQHVGPFYSVSWALVHMLSLDNRYSGKFNALYNAIGSGMESKEAIEKTYGKPLAQVEADLKAYIRGNSVNVVLYNLQFDKVDKVNPRPASSYDWIVAMADLKQAARDADGALQRLEAMVKAEPNRPEAFESMAFVHLMDRSPKSAEAYLAARKNGSKNPNLGFWAPSMLRDNAKAVEELKLTVEQNPDFVEARIRLASMLLYANQTQLAYDNLKAIKKVNRKQAMEYFPPYVRASWTLKKIEESRAAASQFVKTARTDRDKDRAKEIFAFAMEDPPAEPEKVAAVKTAPVFEPEVTEFDLPPDSNFEVVRENGDISVRTKPLSFVEGMMINLECDKALPVANVKTREGEIVQLVIDSPTEINLVNAPGGTGDLVCGEQSNNVRLGYYAKDGVKAIRRFEYLK